MKKLLYILILLYGTLAFTQAKIPKQFVPQITSDMIDASYRTTIESGTGGATSPIEFVVTSVSDLTNGANAGKVARLQTNITLTANTTLANGLTLYGDGGKITGAYTLTCANTNFFSLDNETTIIDDTVTLAGTFNVIEVNADWFDATTTTESALYDNRAAFKNALRVVNYNGGKLQINEGTYYVSMVARNEYVTDPPSLWIGKDVIVSGRGMDKTILYALNNSIEKTEMFTTYNANRSIIQDIWLHGALLEKSDTDKQIEHPSGISVGNKSDDFTVRRVKLTHWSGDGINTDACSTDFPNDFLVFSDGDINDSGADVASTLKHRSAMKNIRTDAFLYDGKFMLSGIGYRTYEGMSSLDYTVYFYDASNAFISKVSTIAYKDVYVPTGATKYRVTIDKTTVTPTQLQMRSPAQSKRLLIEDCEIAWNYRDGWSNLYQGTIIQRCYIHDNGGRLGGPSAGGNNEDGFMELSDVQILYNTFENNVGYDLGCVQCRELVVRGNIFLGATKKDRISGTQFRESWNVLFEDNILYGTSTLGGRGFKAYRNSYYNGGSLMLVGSGSIADGNIFYGGGSVLCNEADRPWKNVSRNNTTYIEKPVTAIAGFVGHLQSYDDTIIISNNLNLGINWFVSPSIETGTDDIPRETKGFTVSGAISNDLGMKLPAQNISDSRFNQGITLYGGRPVKFSLKNNTYTGFIDIQSPNAGTTQTIIIDGGDLNSSLFWLPNYSNCALRTSAININLIVKNLTIDITNGTQHRFLGLNHTGTTQFINCTFKQDTSQSWDLGATYLGSPLNTATNFKFTSCTFTNITGGAPTLRTGDVIE